MKVEQLHKDELLKERQKCLERIARNADKMAKIDRRLLILQSMDLEADLCLPNFELSIFCIQRQATV